MERANGIGPAKIVYDCIEPSPFYAFDVEPYVDEKHSVELPPPDEQNNGLINEPYQKKYYYNPTQLPYTLEKPQFSSLPSEKTDPKRGLLGTPRLNRYFEVLKPYYKLQ